MATTAAKTRKRNARRHNVKLVAIGAFSILSLLGIWHGFNPPTPQTTHAAQSVKVEEDSPAFDCTTMGNRICGPGNSNGVPAGIYDQGGVLIAGWDEWLAALNTVDHNAKTQHL